MEYGVVRLEPIHPGEPEITVTSLTSYEILRGPHGLLWVSGRAFPVTGWEISDYTDLHPPGHVFRRRTSCVEFENGWGASIIWGTGAYGSNYDIRLFDEDVNFTEEPNLVEVGLLYRGNLQQTADGRDIPRFDEFGIWGYAPASEVRELLEDMINWPSRDQMPRPPVDFTERMQRDDG